MNLSSIFGKIKEALNPQTPSESVKPVVQAATEEFSVEPIHPPMSIPEVSAEETQTEIVPRQSKPADVGEAHEKQAEEPKIEVVKEKKAVRSKKEPPKKSPTSQPIIINSPIINEIRTDKEDSIRDLVESAGGSLDKPENRPVIAMKGPDGKFLPGNCANPGGRPKSRLISEELKEILSSEDTNTRTGAERLGKKLMSHAEQEKDGYLSLAAIREITDRVEGKPVQTSNVRGVMVMVPAESVTNALESWADDGN